MRRLAFLVALGLAACASPSQRITTALIERGVGHRQAECMGERLGDRLSIEQLRRLQQLGKIQGKRPGHVSMSELADALNRDGDPKLVAEVVRAGISCVI